MLKNNKGFTGIEIAVVMVAIAVVGYFAAPTTIKAIGSLTSGGDKNQTKQVHKVKEYRTPFYQDEKGKFVPAPKQDMREEYSENSNSEQPRQTLWEKIQKYAFLIGALCLIFPAFGVWLFKRFVDMKNNFKQLVTGIEQAKMNMSPEAITKLETNLSKKMDSSAKAQVKKVKSTIKADDVTKEVVQ